MTSPTPGGAGGDPAANPWARPTDTGDQPAVTWVSPTTGTPVAPPGPPTETTVGAGTARRSPTSASPSTHPAGPARPSRRSATATAPATKPGKPDNRRLLLGFGVAGGGLLILGLVVVLALANTGTLASKEGPLFGPLAGGDPTPSKPPLAQLCPPPSQGPPPGGELTAPSGGPRLADPDSGISYRQLGAPWMPWDRAGWSDGTLGVRFNVGYYFVTERYSRGEYLASVISGKVPATVGDSLTLNLECAGRQVAEDVRREYYPRPNVKEKVRDEQVTVGGRPAWVSTFHLTFEEAGLEARGEQVAVVLVDVGRPDAAVLYISIPDTHRQWNAQIDPIIASIQPI